MKAIVLLRTQTGEAKAVHERLRRLSVVTECCTPFGRYDAAAVVQGESLEELWDIIRIDINLLRGVISSFPCLIEDNQSLRDPPEHLKQFALFSE